VDCSVPALLIKVGRSPIQHGSVGGVRTLGRLGVDVFAVTEDRFTPTAMSRYLRERFSWASEPGAPADELVAGLNDTGARIGARSVLVATDDEAAVLIAEHRAELRERFLLPSVPAELPRRLASKFGLAELCHAHGVPAPRCRSPQRPDDVAEMATEIGFPIVLKNDRPWERLANPAVSSTTVIRDAQELARVAESWPSMPSVMLQEYLPRDRAQDWIVHMYCARDGETVVAFTGLKVRSWRPYAGVTAVACSVPNTALATLAVGFARSLGFRGIADMDWRLDERDGSYKLLDFNPRVGAQFRLFETDTGIDVVRAMHLDLTGRPLPGGRQIDGRRYIVEDLALASAVAYRRDHAPKEPVFGLARAGVERAWLASDDPLPALAAAVRIAIHVLRRLGRKRLRRASESDSAE
jgi:predicted ATP-grasp superfamily ATP-dependent carboligase